MKAILIAGGLGTRLRPLTYTRPKHLLPIANRPHIDHVLDSLEKHGIDEVVLLTSYLAASFEQVVARSRDRGIEMLVAHEEEPLGTAGAIKNAEEMIGGETFFALNGDVLTGADLSEILASHRDSGGAATIVLTPVDDPSSYGVVPTDASGKVERFVEKPGPGEVDTNMINAGIYVLEPEVLASIPGGRVVSIEREVFPALAARDLLYGVSTSAYWMDIGTPSKYLEANVDALAGRFSTDAVPAPGPAAAVIAGSARVAESAQVSSACVGERCVIEQEAVVTGSVLLDGVVVRSGARVTGSILGQDAEVAEGVSVSGRTAGDGETIHDQEVGLQ